MDDPPRLQDIAAVLSAVLGSEWGFGSVLEAEASGQIPTGWFMVVDGGLMVLNGV